MKYKISKHPFLNDKYIYFALISFLSFYLYKKTGFRISMSLGLVFLSFVIYKIYLIFKKRQRRDSSVVHLIFWIMLVFSSLSLFKDVVAML